MAVAFAVVGEFEIADLDPLLVLDEERVFELAGGVDAGERAFAFAIDEDGPALGAGAAEGELALPGAAALEEDAVTGLEFEAVEGVEGLAAIEPVGGGGGGECSEEEGEGDAGHCEWSVSVRYDITHRDLGGAALRLIAYSEPDRRPV